MDYHRCFTKVTRLLLVELKARREEGFFCLTFEYYCIAADMSR